MSIASRLPLLHKSREAAGRTGTEIPLVDLKMQVDELREAIDCAIDNVMTQCDFVLGKAVREFESGFAEWIGVRHAIGVASGLDALKLTMRALEIGTGDEVIVPVNTFTATGLAVMETGARPVFVDCDRDSYLIEPHLAEAAISPRTRAIIPVHLAGQPADMSFLTEVADRHGIDLLEDAAQAHGAQYDGRSCGAMGMAGCFSFYPGKNLGGIGDGGLVTTNDHRLSDRIRCLRNYGQHQKHVHVMAGANSRLDSIQAAVLKVKLKHIDAWNRLRMDKAVAYRNMLEGVGDLVIRPPLPGRTHVYHLFVIETQNRDGLLSHLNAGGVRAGVHYPVPLHLQPAYSSLGYRRGDFPVAEELACRILSLPIYPHLTDQQIDTVCTKIWEWFS